MSVVVDRTGDHLRAEVSFTSDHRTKTESGAAKIHVGRGCGGEPWAAGTRRRRRAAEAILGARETNPRHRWRGKVPGGVRRSVVQQAAVGRASQQCPPAENSLGERSRKTSAARRVHSVASAAWCLKGCHDLISIIENFYRYYYGNSIRPGRLYICKKESVYKIIYNRHVRANGIKNCSLTPNQVLCWWKKQAEIWH